MLHLQEYWVFLVFYELMNEGKMQPKEPGLYFYDTT